MKNIFIATALSGLIIFALLTLSAPENKQVAQKNTKTLDSEEYTLVLNHFKKIVQNQNPGIALAELSEMIKTKTEVARSCHALVHDIGHAAYARYGNFAETIGYQDEICNSGYMHGVIESELQKRNEGAPATATVAALCKNYKSESFSGWECYHGIGHGFMLVTANDLQKSLELCQTLENFFSQDSCENGVFMENFNTDQKLHPSQYLDSADPSKPCPQQKEKNKTNCYIYAPVFYLSLHKNAYVDALRWCGSVEKNYLGACTTGVGSQAMKENIGEPKFVESVCAQAENGESARCIEGMVYLYINHYGSLAPARSLCDTLDFSHKQTCFAAVESQSNLFQN